MDIVDPIKTTVEELGKVLNIENVVGKTIETDEMLLIPVTKMGMGFGAGMGKEKGPEKQGGSGAGAGGAAGIVPLSMIVVFKGVSGPEGVTVMSLEGPDPLTRAIREIGSTAVNIMDKDSEMIMEMIKEKKKKKMEIKETENP